VWTRLKYLYFAIRLGPLFENLKAVRASDPAISSESYSRSQQPSSATPVCGDGWAGSRLRSG